MSETTKTTNYQLLKPNVNADSDLWGDHINFDMDTIDTTMKSIENKAGVVTWNTRAGAVSLTQSDVTTVLPPSAATPTMDGTASAGTNMTWSKSDHIHPTDTTRYSVTNPAGYVTSAQAATAAPVQSVATRTGAVVLTHNDLTDWATTLAPYAPLASPPLTGAPTAPTVTPSSDSSTKLATTAFVQSALGAVPGGAIVSATPPVANPGALWFDSTGGQTYCRYDDGNTQQWVPVSNITGLANAAQLSDVAPAYNNVGRNLIHNSMFSVAQRGAGPWTTNGSFTLDRWLLSLSLDTASISQAAHSDASRAQVGDEAAAFLLGNTFAGNAGAAAFNRIMQRIEDVRRLAGKAVTVSFWAASGAGTPKLGIGIVQSFGTGGSPSAAVVVAGQSVTINTTYTRYSLTFAIPSASGKTLGTANDSNNELSFWFSSGSTNAVTAGSPGVQSGTVAIWGVQLEIAAPGQTQPTQLEKPDPRYDLSNCQRFYQIGTASLFGYAAAGGTFGYFINLPTAMRAAPTISGLGAITASQLGNWGFLATTVSGGTGAASFNSNFQASADL